MPKSKDIINSQIFQYYNTSFHICGICDVEKSRLLKPGNSNQRQALKSHDR